MTEGCNQCDDYQKERPLSIVLKPDVNTEYWSSSVKSEITKLYSDEQKTVLLHVGQPVGKDPFDRFQFDVDDLNQSEENFVCFKRIVSCGNRECHLQIASCTFCCDLKKRKDILGIQEEVCLFHHLHVSTLCYGVGESKHSDRTKKERKLYVRKLERFVSALRNSDGGAILIHIEGLASDDKYLDFYNELVDDKLYDMIDDGELFDKVYKKSWLEDQHGVILLVVRPTSLLSTLNFYTKLSLDNSIKDPLSNTVFRFLRNRKEFTNQPPTVRGLDNIQEGRGIQFKSIEFTSPDVLKSAVQLSDYVWYHLRLKEYISAFSKVEGGGSFYAGISETPKCYKSENYTSKKYAHVGLREHWVKSETEQSTFKDSIFTKLSAETVILQFSGQKIETPASTINLQFYDTGDTGYVLEVAVAAVNGILFYDKEGPESYELTDRNTIRRLSPKEWFERLQEAWDEEQ